MTTPAPLVKTSRQLFLDWIEPKEGGVADRPRTADPGGLTNRGVTMPTLSAFLGREATREELLALTREQAREIFSTMYWNRCRCDMMPRGIDWCVADFAIHSSPEVAVKKLQVLLGFIGKDVDGFVGRKTLQAIGTWDQASLIGAYCDVRRSFIRKLKNYPPNKNGWENRIDSLEVRAVAMSKHQQPRQAVAKDRSDRSMASTLATAGTAILAGLPAAKEAFENVNELVAPYAEVWPYVGLVVGGVVILAVLWIKVRADRMATRAVENGAAAVVVQEK